jgi:hypothetical protein
VWYATHVGNIAENNHVAENLHQPEPARSKQKANGDFFVWLHRSYHIVCPLHKVRNRYYKTSVNAYCTKCNHMLLANADVRYARSDAIHHKLKRQPLGIAGGSASNFIILFCQFNDGMTKYILVLVPVLLRKLSNTGYFACYSHQTRLHAISSVFSANAYPSAFHGFYGNVG